MFEEMKPAPGEKHPLDLRQSRLSVGNGTQRKCAEGVVARVIRKRNRLAVEPHELDSNL